MSSVDPVPPFSAGTLARRALPTALLSLLFAAACSDSMGPAPAAEGPPGGIVFVSDRTGETDVAGTPLNDVYFQNADGTGLQDLTSAPAQIYRDLRLSPDGTRLAFETDQVGCLNVWLVNLDGSALSQLTGQPGERCNEMPRWSPDGTRIAFTSSREPIERSWEAYVMNADGSGPLNVSDDAGLAEGGSDWPHVWMPDGRLVFHHQGIGPPRTFAVAPDGSNREPLLQAEEGYAPFWSPDGSKVAFLSERDGNQDVYLMNADGSGLRNLTQNPADDTFWHGGRANLFIDPWSPDGALIAFVSERDGNREVYVVGIDGTGPRNITNDPGQDRFDGWSPDGTWIAFESDRSGYWHIYAVNLDEIEPWQLTEGPANDWNAVWVPGS